jgi:hypothetical protein
MDAGCEHTMPVVGAVGKFVVVTVGDRWTASCCFDSRDARVAWSCSRSAAAATAGRRTAATTAVSRRATRRFARRARPTRRPLMAVTIIAIRVPKYWPRRAACACRKARPRRCPARPRSGAGVTTMPIRPTAFLKTSPLSTKIAIGKRRAVFRVADLMELAQLVAELSRHAGRSGPNKRKVNSAATVKKIRRAKDPKSTRQAKPATNIRRRRR